MKAIIYSKYGNPDVLELKEIPQPVPNDDEILVKVFATTVTAVDSIFRKGGNFFARLATGILKPKNQIPGTEFSGVIESTGRNVSTVKPGDKIFGDSGTNIGSYAEYICIKESSSFAFIPDKLNLIEAAGIPYGALTALPFLRDNGKIQSNKKILIIGASGSVGTYAVQFAKYFNAEVTGVCSSANIELVKSLKADKVIDYTKEDFTRSDELYDIVFDTVGKSSFSKCKRILKKGGYYLTTVINFSILFQMLLTGLTGNKKAVIAFTGLRSEKEKKDDLLFVRKLVDEGKIKVVVDKTYPLEKIKEAHQYVDSGHKKGNVLLTLNNNH